VAGIGVVVQGIPFLLEHGFGTSFAAFAIGGIVLVVAGIESAPAVVVGMILLGMGNGMATLARATVIADRYGPDAYGTIASVAGAGTMGARAAAPVAAAAWAAIVGYGAMLATLAAIAALAALLAYAAERDARPAIA
jgi:hypothetical protein